MGFKKFKKKPIIVEAVQFTNALPSRVIMEVKDIIPIYHENGDLFLEILTNEGTMVAELGDWIIKEPVPSGRRQYYPCKPDIFENTYELVGE